jgi:hypothetical protein
MMMIAASVAPPLLLLLLLLLTSFNADDVGKRPLLFFVENSDSADLIWK